MENKKLLLEQVSKLEAVLQTLAVNFDIETELSEEYSFLSIVKENLAEKARL